MLICKFEELEETVIENHWIPDFWSDDLEKLWVFLILEKDASFSRRWMSIDRDRKTSWSRYSSNNLFRETYKELVEYLEKGKTNSKNQECSMFG